MTESPCKHPLEALHSDATCAQRSRNALLRVQCRRCGRWFQGVPATHLLLQSIQTSSRQLRDMLCSVGLAHDKIHDPETDPEPQEAQVCAHYLPWLRVDSGGSGSRGYGDLLLIRCAGCKSSWAHSAALRVFLDRIREDNQSLRNAVNRYLGGQSD